MLGLLLPSSSLVYDEEHASNKCWVHYCLFRHDRKLVTREKEEIKRPIMTGTPSATSVSADLCDCRVVAELPILGALTSVKSLAVPLYNVFASRCSQVSVGGGTLLLHAMASFYSTELYVTTDKSALAEEQPLPETLHRMSLSMRVICFLALGRPDLDDHWKSLHSEQAFEIVRSKFCYILASTFAAASVLLAISGVFVSTGSPVPSFDYTSPAPHCLLFMSLMLAMIAVLTSGSSMMRWVHTDRHWTQEQLKPGGYFVLSYLLSIVTPIFFVAWSLNCFMFAMMIAGFYSQSTICCVVTTLWLVTYVVNVGTILTDFMWKYAKSVKSR